MSITDQENLIKEKEALQQQVPVRSEPRIKKKPRMEITEEDDWDTPILGPKTRPDNLRITIEQDIPQETYASQDASSESEGYNSDSRSARISRQQVNQDTFEESIFDQAYLDDVERRNNSALKANRERRMPPNNAIRPMKLASKNSDENRSHSNNVIRPMKLADNVSRPIKLADNVIRPIKLADDVKRPITLANKVHLNTKASPMDDQSQASESEDSDHVSHTSELSTESQMNSELSFDTPTQHMSSDDNQSPSSSDDSSDDSSVSSRGNTKIQYPKWQVELQSKKDLIFFDSRRPITFQNINQLKEKVQSLSNTQHVSKAKIKACFSEPQRSLIIRNVNMAYENGKTNVADLLDRWNCKPKHLFDLSWNKLFELLFAVYQTQDIQTDKDLHSRLIEDIVQLPLHLTGQLSDYTNWLFEVDKVIRSHGARSLDAILTTFDATISKPLLKTLNANLRATPNLKGFHKRLFDVVDGANKPTTFKTWLANLESEYYQMTVLVAQTKAMLEDVSRPQQKASRPVHDNPSDKNKKQTNNGPQNKPYGNPKQTTSNKPVNKPLPDKNSLLSKNDLATCNACGKAHGSKACFFLSSNHPDVNRSSAKFVDSWTGSKYAALKQPQHSLSANKQLDRNKTALIPYDGPVYRPQDQKVSETQPLKMLDQHNYGNKIFDSSLFHVNREPRENLRQESTAKPTVMSKIPIANSEADAKTNLKNLNPIEANLIDVSRIKLNDGQPEMTVYIDSGSLEYNFISYNMVYNLNLVTLNFNTTNNSVKTINGTTVIKKYVVIPQFVINFKGTKKFTLKDQIFLVLPRQENGPFDFLIGLPTIREWDLTRIFRPYFILRNNRTLRAGESSKQFCARLLQQYVDNKRAGVMSNYYATSESLPRDPPAASLVKATIRNSPGGSPNGGWDGTPLMHKHDKLKSVRTAIDSKAILDGDIDDDEIDNLVKPTGWDEYFDRAQQRLPPPSCEAVSINSDLSLKEKEIIISTLNKYSHRFNMKVDEPANIPPLEINVDREKWTKTNSRRYVRPLSDSKKAAVEVFIEQALKDNLIRHSNAGAFSQVLLTPKPNGKWRFCIDYRALNDLSESLGWPIPNIKQMLNNIGTQKPKYFAVLDLTSGYYQAPLAAVSQPLTAFITHKGLYEWTRVPMGAKGAPPYFQYHMVNTVFAGLVHNICEVYLDDIIVWGDSIHELSSRLETLFHRAEEYNITFNPEKCRIGMTEVEYVGHVIDSTGLSFTKAKLDKVEQFRLPANPKDMKSFLGLASYFREHVRNFTELTQPLREMMEVLKPKQALTWTETRKQAYHKVQQAIVNCPKTMFLEPGHPIFVQTDASDYGIGAYLFQRVNGEERPISFISKSLNRVERRWSTIEKEAFAIFYSLMKWEEYLRDTKFTLQTDHKNLTYVNAEPKAKVQRWKLAIQSFDFWLEHIAGESNVVADGFSRFCEKDLPTQEPITLLNITMLNNIVEIEENFLSRSKSHSQTAMEKALRASANKPRRTVAELRKQVASDPDIGMTLIPNLEYKLISSVHNTFVGHLGILRTMRKVREKQLHDKTCSISLATYPEVLLRKHVTTFIKQCPCCQKMSQLKPYIHTYKYVTMKYGVLENLAMDTIVGLPRTAQGYEHLLVIVDTFSRYIQLVPLKSLSSLEAIQALSKWMNTFGKPFSVLTDNASQMQLVYKETLEHLGVEDRKIHPYSHEENSIVERTNKEVERHLRNIMFHEKVHSKWDEFLSAVERIKNNEICESTGVTPVELIFGRNVNLDRGILYPLHQVPLSNMKMSDYILRQREIQAIALQVAQETQAKTDAKHLATGSSEHRKTEFRINDYVLVAYEKDGHKAPTKLHPILRGPCQIVNKVARPEGDIYTVQHMDSNKIEDFHVKLLRPFHHDARYTDPSKVATADNLTFEVETILDHKFLSAKQMKSTMEVLVQWTGYETPTWEPYSNVANVSVFHEYLRTNNLSRLLRASFKEKDHDPPLKKSRHKK